MKKKNTIRHLPSITRKLAKDINVAQLAIKRIEKRIDMIAQLERDNISWEKRQSYYKSNNTIDPIF
jgi:hypothetical protein